MRPTKYLRDWSARDRGLAEGLLVHEDSIGPHGIPWAVALDPESDGWLEVVEVVDYAQAALDRWRKDRREKAEPGARTIVVDTRRPSGAGPDDPHSEQSDADHPENQGPQVRVTE